jgi:hypothetical protein
LIWCLERDPDIPPLALIKARYEAAYEAALREITQRIEASPIDDAAWERELERRRTFFAVRVR